MCSEDNLVASRDNAVLMTDEQSDEADGVCDDEDPVEGRLQKERYDMRIQEVMLDLDLLEAVSGLKETYRSQALTHAVSVEVDSGDMRHV